MTPLQNDWRRFKSKAWRQAHMYELPTSREIAAGLTIISLLILVGALGLVNAVSAYQINQMQNDLKQARQTLSHRRFSNEKRLVGDTLVAPISLHHKVSLASR